ncbi:hypothetical protein QFZ85_003486 [Pseudomonas frederiksbergensis]
MRNRNPYKIRFIPLRDFESRSHRTSITGGGK